MRTFKDQQAHLRCSRQASNNLDLAIPYVTIPCGLVARIRRFHRRGRGSIPRKGAWQIFTIIPPTGMLVQIRVPKKQGCLETGF